MAFCTACGHLIPADYRFCGSCGASQGVQVEQESQPNPAPQVPTFAEPTTGTTASSGKRKKVLISVVAAVAVMLAVIGGIAYFNKADSPSPEASISTASLDTQPSAAAQPAAQGEPVGHAQLHHSFGEEITSSSAFSLTSVA